jgi:hypothetical protein
MHSQDLSKSTRPKVIISIMALLGLWLIALLALASWYQGNYIQAFTQETPDFLNSSHTEDWFKELSDLLPEKNTKTRVIQFWKPDCICNRFAQRHSLSAIKSSKQVNAQHITLIPNADAAAVKALQALNPDTNIITLPSDAMTGWPASPSLFVEGPLGKVQYFGPLGFGAFCSQSSSNIIEQQLRHANSSSKAVKAFFNVIGKGCFCQWAG